MSTGNGSEMMAQLPAKLRTARDEAELSRTEAAQRAGLSGAPVIQRYENGERIPALDILERLAIAYNKDIGYFLGISEMRGHIDVDVLTELIRESRPANAYARLDRIIDDITDEKQLLDEIAKEISNIVQIAVVAIFKHNWDSDELIRVSHYIDPRFEQNLPSFEETYYPWRRRHISELAWTQEDHRFIKDYREIFRNRPSEVNSVSYEWHERVLGDILSTMYGKIGLREDKYLVRCFNRSDFPDVRLSENQFGFLNKLCEHISERLFAKTSERRFIEKRRINGTVMQWPDVSVDKKLDELKNLLGPESISSCAVLWTHEVDIDDIFTHARVFGPAFLTWPITDGMKTTGDDLYQLITGYDGAFLLEVPGDIKNSEPFTLEEHLMNYREDVTQYLGLPFKIKELKASDRIHSIDDPEFTRKGVMLISLRKRHHQAPPLTTNVLTTNIPETLDVLQTVAAIAGSIIRTHYERLGELPA